MRHDTVVLTLDMTTKVGMVVPCGQFTHASLQVIPHNYASTSAVIEAKGSLTGERADAQSWNPVVTPNMTTKALTEDVSVTGVSHLHIEVTTADSGKRCAVVVYLTDKGANDGN